MSHGNECNEHTKAGHRQGYIISYKGVREGLHNKMKSEERPEVENSRPTTASVKSPSQQCANWARMEVKAGRTVRDEARGISGSQNT